MELHSFSIKAWCKCSNNIFHLNVLCNIHSMVMDKLLVVVFILFVGSTSGAKSLPKYIKYCHQDDPQISACFERAIEDVKPHLSGGIPEFQLPPMDPLFLPEAALSTGSSFNAIFRNIRIYDAFNFDLKEVKVDLKNNHFLINLMFPKIRITTDYSIQGRLLFMRLDGKGPSDGNFTNVDAKIILDGTRNTKNGKQYLKFQKKNLVLNLGTPSLRFDNIFGNNIELNEQTNEIININSVAIVEELGPVINNVVADFVFGLANRIFLKYSFDELFPE